jgi:hypothetical protein
MLGKVQRRRPYDLGKHSNSNKNFEIHIFANNIIPGKSGMLQCLPKALPCCKNGEWLIRLVYRLWT